MTDITVTMTRDEAQYLVDAMDTYVKTHGLKVAMGGVILLTKLQTATGDQAPTDDKVVDENTPEEE